MYFNPHNEDINLQRVRADSFGTSIAPSQATQKYICTPPFAFEQSKEGQQPRVRNTACKNIRTTLQLAM